MDPPYYTTYTNAPGTSTAGNVYEPQYTESEYLPQAPPYGHPIVSTKALSSELLSPQTLFFPSLGVEMTGRLSFVSFWSSTDVSSIINHNRIQLVHWNELSS